MAIKSIRGFSGHSDHQELIRFVSEMQPSRPRNVVLVHGDPSKIYELARKLSAMKLETYVPRNGDTMSFV